MDFNLSPQEVRILGALIEKQMTTPDYYPMTLNGLTNACNQKTNREPVVSYGEDEVMDRLDEMRAKGLVMKVSGGGGRVPKHRHRLDEVLKLSEAEMALLAVAMLRGPQTTGELRARTDRMVGFENLEQVDETLERMIHRERPLMVRLPRQLGRKEHRYAHLLSGPPEEGAGPSAVSSVSARSESPGASGASSPATERIEELEEQVRTLSEQLSILRKDFEDFRGQF